MSLQLSRVKSIMSSLITMMYPIKRWARVTEMAVSFIAEETSGALLARGCSDADLDKASDAGATPFIISIYYLDYLDELHHYISHRMSFGMLVLGPSGSGKSTLCASLNEIYSNLDIPVTLISLDPANETLKYQTDIDIRDLITIQDVMEQYGIGPNAAMLYCIQFLEKNIEWLINKITPKLSTMLIFDLPGQIELYINHDSMKNIIKKLTKMEIQICTVQLFDCCYVYELKHFFSLCMMSLASLVHFQTPHVNVLSKIDLMKQRRPDNDFNQILNCSNLQQMVEIMNSKPEDREYLQAISKIIDSYGMVSFTPLDVSKIELMSNLIFEIETALGSIHGREKNVKFKTMMEKFYKQPTLHKEIMRHELEGELFPEEAHDGEYYANIMRQYE